MNASSPHTFHIPVMGLAFTIDSPIKVARFGISSVISIMEDRLIEMMRSHYYPTINQEYHPITVHEEDYRAKRITDYLNLVNSIVQSQIEKIKKAAFVSGSEIVKYFEMLPDESALKQIYIKMLLTVNSTEKEKLEKYLRTQIVPGSIDVNIMTKTDRNNYSKNGELLEDKSDAVAALRGYAKSNLKNSSVIFSAGMNPRLYNYLGTCKEFEMNNEGGFTKKVVVKVSDYRSALIQGKYLAKKGIWVSEFRIESGLNCGGHAFATEGYLLGPILEEFKFNKQQLINSLFEIYASHQKNNNREIKSPPPILFSVQGGIGNHEEDFFLRNYYNFEKTGWGTPFLLVPEATTVDESTLKLLCDAKEKDIVLSNNSPLGVRFHYLKGTSSEVEKSQRVTNGKPGSPCTEKHLGFNVEFTKEGICTASHKFQKLKIAQLKTLNLPEIEFNKQLNEVMNKECLCVGLSNPAAIVYNKTFIKKLNAVTICPGPNIVNFSNVVSLQKMVDHIYGRANLVTSANRPQLFIKELYLYIDYLKEQLIDETFSEQLSKKKKFYLSFCQNLKDGIKYYYNLPCTSQLNNAIFSLALNKAKKEIDQIINKYAISIVENERLG